MICIIIWCHSNSSGFDLIRFKTYVQAKELLMMYCLEESFIIHYLLLRCFRIWHWDHQSPSASNPRACLKYSSAFAKPAFSDDNPCSWMHLDLDFLAQKLCTRQLLANGIQYDERFCSASKRRTLLMKFHSELAADFSLPEQLRECLPCFCSRTSFSSVGWPH